MKHRTLVISLFLVSFILVICVSPAQGDTYRQLKANLRQNINDHGWGTWDRFVCVADCYAAWADQKLTISITVANTSTGWDGDTYPQQPYLVVDSGAMATVDFEIDENEENDPEKIDLYLINDIYNPVAPGFGVLVGSDTNVSDGWSITFDLDTYGTEPWCGFLLAEATFPDGAMEPDDPGGYGDAAALFITRDAAGVPEPSVLGLLLVGGFILKRRRITGH